MHGSVELEMNASLSPTPEAIEEGNWQLFARSNRFYTLVSAGEVQRSSRKVGGALLGFPVQDFNTLCNCSRFGMSTSCPGIPELQYISFEI